MNDLLWLCWLFLDARLLTHLIVRFFNNLLIYRIFAQINGNVLTWLEITLLSARLLAIYHSVIQGKHFASRVKAALRPIKALCH